MRQIKVLGLVILATCALSAVATATAQALEGPFFRVKGAFLTNGESKTITAKEAEDFVLEVPALALKVTCRSLALENGKIIGSAKGNFDFSKQVLLFTECSVTGNGTNCKVEKEAITTNEVTGKLAFSNNKREGKLLTVFQPSEGTVFAKIKFVPATGGTCTIAEASVTGKVAAEDWQGTAPVEVFGEKEAKVNEVNFPVTPIAAAWLEENAEVPKEVKLDLTVAGFAATLRGRAEIERAGEEWGVWS